MGYNGVMFRPGDRDSRQPDRQPTGDRPAAASAGLAAAASGAADLTGADDPFGFHADEANGLSAGTRIGGCTIVGLLAEGGMGRVYEARQDAPARAVAVKVMRAGLGSAGLARRFAHEADLLGRLRHPAIAQIHSAGLESPTEGGGPFIVMELVAEGTSITDLARNHGLEARDRVALLTAAAAGVAHAHQAGIIHRDLKPANILVDAGGLPKIIDFGVGRAVGCDAERLTSATQQAELLGTVRYMSPEQLGLDADEIDARSDVYALGLVLHELLTGELPYELRGRSVLDAACVLANSSGVPVTPLANRLRRSGIPRPAARPLAAVIARCLEPRPADRYPTAVHLEADLGRWLAGEPVRARPPSLGEAVARLARRHRAATVAAVTVVVALVATVAGVSTFWLRAEGLREAAERSQAAEVEARIAAEAARSLAEEARIEADTRTAEARYQLYLSTVLLAAEARDRDNLAEARRLLAEATALAPERGSSPVELDCLAASLDESLATLGDGGPTVSAVAWSPDGRIVATGTMQGRLRLWRRGRADPLPPEATDAAPLPAHKAAVWDLAFAPDGRLLASASADGTALIHDLDAGGPPRPLEGHGDAVYAVAFSPDGKRLATASRDRTVRLWDRATWEECGVLAGHAGTVYSARFSPDGERIVSASQDGTVRVWMVADGRQELILEPDGKRVFRAVFSPRGDRIGAAAEDGSALVWDAVAGEPLARFQHPLRVNAVAFMGDGDRLATASGDGLLRCWDVETGDETSRRRGHAGAIWSLAATPDGAAATGSADGFVKLWQLDGEADPTLRLGDRGQALAIDPGGTILAAGDAAGRVLLADLATLRADESFTPGAGRVNAANFSPDGSMLAVACDDGRVHRWQIAGRHPLPALAIHSRRVYGLCFSPDGTLLATGSEDRTARLADAATGDARPPLRHPARVFGVAFDQDGRRLATACGDRCVRVWDVASGRELAALTGHSGPVNWVAFSPAGDLLASASSDRSVRLWDAERGQLVAILTGPARQVWRVAFSPDGTRVAASVADGTVQLWDVASGRPVAVLRAHRDQAWGLTFAPGGHSLATTSWDGTVRLWGISAAALARARGEAQWRDASAAASASVP